MIMSKETSEIEAIKESRDREIGSADQARSVNSEPKEELMEIDISQLEEFLPVFVPSIVEATMATCEASALLRELSEAEVIELTEKVSAEAITYIEKTAERLKTQGAQISDALASKMAKSLYDRIFENAWALIQRAEEEMKKY